VTIAALAVGCGGGGAPDAAGGVDAGRDAGAAETDAGAGTDAADAAAGADAEPDAGAEVDAGTEADAGAGADAGPDAAADPDAGPPCATSFACEAETAPSECGVVTPVGRRHPDLGAPYCSDRLSRAACTCDLVICESPGPLCAGTYVLSVRQRLISGCSGIEGELSGTCESMWNVLEPVAGGAPLVDQRLFNVDLTFAMADYTSTFSLAAPEPVRVRVEQDCWLSDVSGVGNAGRGEVDRVAVGP
jgi:hypothetical protein